jgi:hypothetical protein
MMVVAALCESNEVIDVENVVCVMANIDLLQVSRSHPLARSGWCGAAHLMAAHLWNKSITWSCSEETV